MKIVKPADMSFLLIITSLMISISFPISATEITISKSVDQVTIRDIWALSFPAKDDLGGLKLIKKRSIVQGSGSAIPPSSVSVSHAVVSYKPPTIPTEPIYPLYPATQTPSQAPAPQAGNEAGLYQDSKRRMPNKPIPKSKSGASSSNAGRAATVAGVAAGATALALHQGPVEKNKKSKNNKGGARGRKIQKSLLKQ